MNRQIALSLIHLRSWIQIPSNELQTLPRNQKTPNCHIYISRHWTIGGRWPSLEPVRVYYPRSVVTSLTECNRQYQTLYDKHNHLWTMQNQVLE